MPMRRRILFTVMVVLLLLIIAPLTVFIAVVPSPIDAVAWTPPTPPDMTGALAPNDALRDAEIIGEGMFNSPEDIAFDAQGRLYTGGGANPGAIMRVTFADDGEEIIEVFADYDGAPLDMRFDPAGNLIVADWVHGLVSIDPAGEMTVLLPIDAMIDGTPFRHPDGIDIGDDGTLYVSLGSVNETYHLLNELLDARPYGRLIAYQPETGEGRVLIDELYFGNGVQLAPDESFVLVADQYRYRIARYWLTGEQAGTWDYFVENLPGFVHNIHYGDDGLLWAGLNTRRVPLIDAVHPYPFLKEQLAKLPENILRGAGGVNRGEDVPGVGIVLAMDAEGNIVRSLHNPPPTVYTVSVAQQYGDSVYIGSLDASAILRYRLPE